MLEIQEVAEAMCRNFQAGLKMHVHSSVVIDGRLMKGSIVSCI